jgi:Zn-dependent protease
VDLLRHIDIGTIAIQFAVLLFSLSIHEASHAWMADRLGDYTARYLGRVTINPIPHIDPFGTIVFPLLQFFTNLPLLGWAKPVPINPIHLRKPQRDQMLISLAGPGSNLLASFVAFGILVGVKLAMPEARGIVNYLTVVGHIPGGQSILAPILGILYYAMIINVLLAIFNIIPVPPLDGHWILYMLLPASAAATLERISSYGFILLYLLMFSGLLRYILVPPIRLIIVLLGIF